MGRSYRQLPLTVVDVPKKYIDMKSYWQSAKRTIRLAACVFCGNKGKIGVIGMAHIKWAHYTKLPKSNDYLTKSGEQTDECLYGACQPCFDEHGAEGAKERLLARRAVIQKSIVKEVQDQLREEDQERN